MCQVQAYRSDNLFLGFKSLFQDGFPGRLFGFALREYTLSFLLISLLQNPFILSCELLPYTLKTRSLMSDRTEPKSGFCCSLAVRLT
jgi:hypothetical protein